MTSGSTGTPKLARRPSHSAIAEARHYAATMHIREDDIIHCVTPLSHAYAFGLGFMTPLLTGADVIATRSFNPRITRRILAEAGATILPAAPAMLPLMARAGVRSGAGLRLLLTAGAPLQPGVAEAFERASGIVPRPLFGTTETGGISVSMEICRTSAVGRPMAGVDVEICDPELETGTGRIRVRSSSIMDGYLCHDGGPAGLEPGGWFRTDDLGAIGDDGQIELLGRVSDVVNVAGFKVMPQEVEMIIAAMPQVVEVKAYRARSPRQDEILAVAIVADGRLDPALVHDACRASMARHKCPTAIHVLEDLPRLSNGKIDVGALPSAMGAP
jgi:long-chain acyl-CoA synthetase